jgi:hypothetical protein
VSGSTHKHNLHRALALERLLRSWDKAPEKRLGQLIVDGLGMDTMFDVLLLRSIPDEELLEAIERHLAGLGRSS